MYSLRMFGFVRRLALLGLILPLPIGSLAGECAADAMDSYDVLLHSQSLAEQRAALTAILENPQKYVPRIQQSLRDYPQLLRTDPTAAKRAAYISALVRDPSFAPILAKSLAASEVQGDCEYACPVIFALTIQAYFGGWNLPPDLDSQLTTVGDLKAAIAYMPRISLKPGRIEDVVQGPGLEEHRKEIEGKTEEELIYLAGPMTSSLDTRMYAAFRLQTLVSESKNRIDLYLLALNDFEDASSEYRGAVYQSIYRAELANVQSRSASKTIDDEIYVGILDDAREDVRDGKTNPIERRVVMPAFEKHDGEWQVIKHFSPHSLTWTIAFDGKNLGQVASQASSVEADQINSDSSRAKQALVTLPDKVPTVGKRSKEFTGVSSLFGLDSVRRPLIVVSKPYYRDPDAWKRTQLSEETSRLVRDAFRKQYPHVDRCKDEKIAEHDWKFPDSALKLPYAYASNKNAFIVAVSLDAGNCGWGGHPEDPTDAFVYQWFLVAANSRISRIGGFQVLVDAGDYDNDGRSELIFFSTRSESSDVYDLLYDGFQKKVELVVGYR
jgi:hypothetical protein